MIKLGRGVTRLHRSKIFHRGVDLMAIKLYQTGEVKLHHMEHVKYKTQKTATVCGNPDVQDPDVTGNEYDAKDVDRFLYYQVGARMCGYMKKGLIQNLAKGTLSNSQRMEFQANKKLFSLKYNKYNVGCSALDNMFLLNELAKPNGTRSPLDETLNKLETDLKNYEAIGVASGEEISAKDILKDLVADIISYKIKTKKNKEETPIEAKIRMEWNKCKDIEKFVTKEFDKVGAEEQVIKFHELKANPRIKGLMEYMKKNEGNKNNNNTNVYQFNSNMSHFIQEMKKYH